MFQIDYSATGSDRSIRVSYDATSLTLLDDVSDLTLNPVTLSTSTTHVTGFDNLTYLTRVHYEGVYDITVGLDTGYLVLIPTLPSTSPRRQLVGKGSLVGCRPHVPFHHGIRTNIDNRTIDPVSVGALYELSGIPQISSTTTLSTATLYELPNLSYILKSKRDVSPFTNYCLHLNFSAPVTFYRHRLYHDSLTSQAFACSETPTQSPDCYILLP